MKERLVRAIWTRANFLGWIGWLLLLPLAALFRAAVHARNFLYRVRWLPTRQLPRAVISVGNLTVGGTGKTPTTVWLAQELQRRGHSVAILSRGYKRTSHEPLLLDPDVDGGVTLLRGDGDSLHGGDEAVMMASLFGQRVGVGRDRYHVGLRLLERAPVDVFILDDGFQHLRLGRDLDLLLLGTDESGSLLPAGPFREPRSAARRAQAFIITGQAEPWRKVLRDVPPDKIFTGSLSAVALLTLEGNGRKEYPPSLLDRSKIVAVSAIAKPAAFYRMIQEWEGEIVDALEFPDHHAYSSRDWQLINRAARGVDFIVTTEKDLVKLARFPFAREKLFALRVAMKVENATALLDVVERTIREQVSGTEAG